MHGRCVVDVPVRSLDQPVADGRRLVGSIVVHDEMNIDIGGDVRFDLVEKATELGRSVPGETFADDPPGGDIERGEQRGRAVSLVVVRPTLGLARAHGQQGLGAVERLDLAFLVDAQDQRPVRRGQVEADHVAHFRDEVGIGGELEGLDPVRLEAERRQIRWTVAVDRPLARAMPRELQWLPSAGKLSRVRWITASIRSSPHRRADDRAMRPPQSPAPHSPG